MPYKFGVRDETGGSYERSLMLLGFRSVRRSALTWKRIAGFLEVLILRLKAEDGGRERGIERG